MIRRQPSSTLFPYTTLSRSYGDGRSEKLISRLLQERPDDEIFVATKAGRRLDPHTAEGYNKENLTAFVERSLTNLGVEALDLLQLHCPPTEAYRQDSKIGRAHV